MRRNLLKRAWYRWLPCMVTLAALCVPECLHAQESEHQKKVLVLYSTGRDAPVSLTGERELPRILSAGLASLDYHSEYIDAGRFPDLEYQAGFRDFLQVKYAEQKFDVVIAMHDVAIAFLNEHRDTLFPDTPVVFLARRPVARRIPNSTGVAATVELGQTLKLATALQPDIDHVFVVSGAANRDRAIEGQAREQFRQFEPRLTFTYLSGLPTNQLGARLATLPERSIVYYLLVYRDGSGELFQPVEYLDRISHLANRPIYSWVDSAMDHGVVGGSLQNQEAEIVAAARLALRVLHGERADQIPISGIDLKSNQVDWRQLRRWGISEARVPNGTVVRFREFSIWERYKLYILGAGALLLAQTALIAGLLVQAARRRRAEEQVHRNQAELHKSYARISDLGGRLLISQEAERSRIARELHDDLSQQMAVLATDLKLLSGMGQDRDGHAETLAREALERAQSIARSVHELSHRLHPASLRLVGLVPALDGLRRELSHGDFSIAFSHENVAATLPHDLTLCVFRVVQEALQNAVKHSGARDVSVHLKGSDATLTLTIVDDGTGFDVESVWGKGLGLVSMRERMESIGGTIAIHSEPGAGTRLEAILPVPVVRPTEPVAVLISRNPT